VVDVCAATRLTTAGVARDPGAVLSREQLLDAVTRRPDDVYDRVVDVHVANLRRKLGDDAADPWLVETIPQVGYRLVATRDERELHLLDHGAEERRAARV